MPYLVKAQFQHQPVCHKLDVLLHHVTIHTNQLHWKCLGQELLDKNKSQLAAEGSTQTKHVRAIGLLQLNPPAQ